MIEVDTKVLSNIPLTSDQLAKVIKDVYAEINVKDLTDTNQIIFPYVFAPVKEEPDLAGGFEIEIVFQRDGESIKTAITKFILLETEDEFFEACKRVKELKSK